ncbi:hypothetical protein [Pseudomonas sp. SM4]|uniref:hypothetical protein n=1 Tax=Pseudomonas sp. SM4 TaxID=3424177 RepID=UPI003F78CA2D
MDVRIKPISVGTLSEQVLAQGTKPLAPSPIDIFRRPVARGFIHDRLRSSRTFMQCGYFRETAGGRFAPHRG